MSITLQTQPDNVNFLSPLGFQFSIKKLPHVNYFIQSVSIPSLELGDLTVQNPFTRIPLIGDHVEFGQLTMSFKIDEDMNNYIELFNWMVELGFPEKFKQSQNIRRSGDLDDKPTSDGTLIILNSAMRGNIEILFEDLVPLSLSEITFNTTGSTVDYLECQVTFRYTLFKVYRLSSSGRVQISS